MAREGMDRGMTDWDGARPFDTTGRFFRQDREDRPVFRPLPRDWRSPARPTNRQYNRFYPRNASR
jgi:hypothetical protein